MKTDISEDPKGDVDKETPRQPVPGRRAQEGIEPLLPPLESASSVPPDGPEHAHETEGDRTGQQAGVTPDASEKG